MNETSLDHVNAFTIFKIKKQRVIEHSEKLNVATLVVSLCFDVVVLQCRRLHCIAAVSCGHYKVIGTARCNVRRFIIVCGR